MHDDSWHILKYLSINATNTFAPFNLPIKKHISKKKKKTKKEQFMYIRECRYKNDINTKDCGL